jgi:hypothetical protein
MLSTNADALTAGLTLPSPQSPTKNEVHDFSNALEAHLFHYAMKSIAARLMF